VGIADGKFAAYVAAVRGAEIGAQRGDGRRAARQSEAIPQAVLSGAKDLYLNLGAAGAGGTDGKAPAPAEQGSFSSPMVRGRYGRGLPDSGGSALPGAER
jgi:hypothetical protein